jgi:hypothetical protein
VKGWYCGKKIYMDKVSNDQGDIAFVCRLKGIKPDVIGITANLIYTNLVPVEYKNISFYAKFGLEKS